MSTIEVGIMYDQIVKGTIIKTKNVDRGIYVLNTKLCANVLIKYILTSINLTINVIIRDNTHKMIFICSIITWNFCIYEQFQTMITPYWGSLFVYWCHNGRADPYTSADSNYIIQVAETYPWNIWICNCDNDKYAHISNRICFLIILKPKIINLCTL